MTDHIQLPPPDYTENVQGFVHDTQRHYYSEETMRAYAERLHAARVYSPAIMQAIGLLAVLQSWIGPRRPENSEPDQQTLWDQIEATRIALTPLAPAGEPAAKAAHAPRMPRGESAAMGLRAMATNYPVGHLWDKLDAKTCIRGALEIEALRATQLAAPAAQGEPLARWEDAQVQTVYRVLCADEAPAKGEHWEGWCARRIVDALAAQPASREDTPATTGQINALVEAFNTIISGRFRREYLRAIDACQAKEGA